MRFIPLIFAIILFATLSWYTYTYKDYQNTQPNYLVSTKLPELPINTYKQEEALQLPKNSAYLINIFGSWCLACKIEHPVLMELQSTLPIVGIAWKDDEQALDRLLEKRGSPYHAIGWDPDGQAVIALGATGTPESFLVDDTGTIRFRYQGPLTQDIIQQHIIPLLP